MTRWVSPVPAGSAGGSRRRRRTAWALLAGAVVAGGCGYALVGKGGSIDASIQRLGVPLFRDTTGRAGLDRAVTDRVAEELLKRGRVQVVRQATDVDAVVEGEITAYEVRPVGFSTEEGGATQASRYAVTLTARVRYFRPGASEPMWANDSFSFRDEYEVGADPSGFLDREEQAVDRICAAFARSLVATMLEAF